MRKNTCIRCGGAMQSMGTMEFQRGSYGLLLGNLNHLASGALEAEVYACKTCGKLEFYLPEEEKTDAIAQAACPRCGKLHDLDDAVCPHCGTRLMD